MSKAPVPGRVKTRLAQSTGDEAAARVQAAFLEDVSAFAPAGVARLAACAPNPDHPAFEAMGRLGWRLEEQGRGDLGTRLQRWLEAMLAEGYQRVVFVGSDSPTLPAQLLEQAFDSLRNHDVVLGPVFDGGYYLVGARRADTGLFEQIDWGTERVFAQSIERLSASAATFRVLPYWYDVDDLDDLRALARQLGLPGPYGPVRSPATEELLESAPELLGKVGEAPSAE